MEPAGTAPAAPDEAPTTVQEPVAAPGAACARCGAPLRPEQEWCLNCGAAAGTRIAAPSGWKVPVAIVASVLTLALAALVVAFLAVSDDDDALGTLAQTKTQAAPAAPAPAPPAPTPAPPAPSPAPGAEATPTPTIPPAATGGEQPGADEPTGADGGAATSAAGGDVGSWPAGKRGFTVVLASPTSRAAAEKRAEAEAAKGTEVGVLDSDDFSSLRGGYFVVFSGVYDTENAAEAALEGLGDADGAYIRRVTPR